MTDADRLAPAPCPWSWRGLLCARERAHSSPHHIVGEQPQFDAAICPDPADHALAEKWRGLMDDVKATASSRGMSVSLIEHVIEAVALADAVRDLFSNGYSVLRGCPCGDKGHAEVRHLDADKVFAVVGMADR